MKRLLFAALVLVMIVGCGRCEDIRYQDGVYRGFYYEDGMEQVAVQFELKDGTFKSVILRNLMNQRGSFIRSQEKDWEKRIIEHFAVLCDYLEGKTPDEIDDLYAPAEILAQDGLEMSDRIQYSKLISALWDGLNRRPYKLVDTSKLPEADPYPDGIYTGTYRDDDGEQVVLDFVIQDNRFVEIKYRKLEYKGIDYLEAGASEAVRTVAGQFQQMIDYLIGREISAVNALYQPGSIAEDADAFSAATLRAPKVISALWEGLNRNTYIMD